jgi:hypothetical protein
MKTRLAGWWFGYRMSRDPSALLLDLWIASVAIALVVGFAGGWLSRG